MPNKNLPSKTPKTSKTLARSPHWKRRLFYILLSLQIIEGIAILIFGTGCGGSVIVGSSELGLAGIFLIGSLGAMAIGGSFLYCAFLAKKRFDTVGLDLQTWKLFLLFVLVNAGVIFSLFASLN